MLNVSSRYAIGPSETKQLGTDGLREQFLAEGLFVSGEINLLYTHYDRMIVGGVAPSNADLVLDTVKPCGTPSILDRREIGILNIGESASVSTANESFQLNRGDVLYLGMGSGAITFGQGGRFYVVSTPAHRSIPSKLITIENAVKIDLGASETANERTIYQFIHPDVMESCQLVMGYTMLKTGSVWNTMPTHVHDRRMEAYMYFDIEANNRVFHFMGESDETRHLVVKNEEVAFSPPWSIHCGCGTSNYTFCWAMAGDNVDYKDAEVVALEDMR